MHQPPQFPLRIYYDGACRVCAAEIGHYLRRDRQGLLVGVDISDPDFDPHALGLTIDALMTELHAIDQAGSVYRNIEAFRAIWQAFPGTLRYRLLVALFTAPVFSPLARCGYRLFARVRRHLPRQPRCDGDTCRFGDHRPSSRR